MVTKAEAISKKHFEHLTLKNSDGTPLRCRATGQCKIWKTRPNEFSLPVKYGLRISFYITQLSAAEWKVAA